MSLPKPFYEEDGITIYCGDAHKILPLIDKVDMIFTDPPYGHNNNNGDLIHHWEKVLGKSEKVNESRPIQNDGIEANDLVRWLFKESKRVLAEDGCCCCCCGGGGGPDPQFARWSLWMDEYLSFKQMVIWDKGPMGMGWHYRRSYETVLVGSKGKKCRWYDSTDKIENIIRPGDYGIKKIIPSAKDHPTPKPMELSRHFIKLHSRPGDVILDPFCGAGSTLEAAKETGRKAIGIDLEDRWLELSIKRLRQEILKI